MKHFDVSAQIIVPKDPKFEGEAIEGIISVSLCYPVKTKAGTGFLAGKYNDMEAQLEKPVSIHIFEATDKIWLTEAKGRLMFIRLWSTFLSAVGGLIILFLYFGLEKSKNNLEGVAVILSTLMAIVFGGVIANSLFSHWLHNFMVLLFMLMCILFCIVLFFVFFIGLKWLAVILFHLTIFDDSAKNKK